MQKDQLIIRGRLTNNIPVRYLFNKKIGDGDTTYVSSQFIPIDLEAAPCENGFELKVFVNADRILLETTFKDNDGIAYANVNDLLKSLGFDKFLVRTISSLSLKTWRALGLPEHWNASETHLFPIKNKHCANQELLEIIAFMESKKEDLNNLAVFDQNNKLILKGGNNKDEHPDVFEMTLLNYAVLA